MLVLVLKGISPDPLAGSAFALRMAIPPTLRLLYAMIRKNDIDICFSNQI